MSGFYSDVAYRQTRQADIGTVYRVGRVTKHQDASRRVREGHHPPPKRADNGSVGHGSNGSTNLGGSRGSRVSTGDPLTHFTLYSSGIPRDFLVHGKPATAIESVILTVC